MKDTYDVIVLGAGSAGEVAAMRLASAGLRVALIESDLVGGECPYWACMPAKALLRPGQVLADARRVPGAAEAITGAIDVAAVARWRDRLAAGFDDRDHASWVEGHGVEIVRGHGRITGPKAVEVEGAARLEARRAVIVATGSEALIPDIPGADAVTLWDSRSVTTASVAPESLLVIGGGAVGLESAQAWYRLGTGRVVVVETQDRLLPREEPFAGTEIAAAFTAEGIDVLTGVTVDALHSAQKGNIEVHTSDGASRTVEVVLAAAGRSPLTRDIGLESIGLTPGEWIEVDASLRSRHHPEWLFAVGDVNGEDLFTHMGKYEARVAADVILGRPSDATLGRTAGPRVVFTDPLVAAVGQTAEQAAERGVAVDLVEVAIGEQAEAALWGGDLNGTARFVVDQSTKKLVGATFSGPSALSEMVIAAQMAIVGGVPLEVFAHVVPQFPSFSEVWLEFAG